MFGTDPSSAWDDTEKTNHIGDEWIIYAKYNESTSVWDKSEVLLDDYETRNFIWDGTGWGLNQVIIDGGRLTAGSVLAEHIDVTGLFTTSEIHAENFSLEQGTVGGFEVDSVLKSVDRDWETIL